MKFHWFFLVAHGWFACINADNHCLARSYGDTSVVCVCTETHCDWVEETYPIPSGHAVSFTTSKSGKRLQRGLVPIEFGGTNRAKSEDSVFIQLHTETQKQKIEGFGGCLTDGAAMNIFNLSQKMTETLIESYFSAKGIEYNMARVVLSSCDASTHVYSYDDTKDDFDLKNFQLADEDLKYKIPTLTLANKVASRPLKFFGSSWGSPGWMKATGKMQGSGELISDPTRKYEKTWAKYYVKFLEEYAKHNISFWGMTTQNEPVFSCNEGIAWQGLCFFPETQRDFIKFEFGPALWAAGFSHLKILIFDDNRNLVLPWTSVIMDDPDARKYVSGVAVHWYLDPIVSPITLDLTHDAYPDLFILQTEASQGHVNLGNWELANHYAFDIIENLNHWAAGWIEWNLAMNLVGGPSWVNNLVDSPIIVNTTANEFYKQPIFYAIGHFSKFLPPGSVRIDYDAIGYNTGLETTAFLSPTKNETIIILLNTSDRAIEVIIYQNNRDSITVSMEAFSIETIIWPFADHFDDEEYNKL